MNDIIKLAVQVAPLLPGPHVWSVEPNGNTAFQHIIAEGDRRLVMHAHNNQLLVTAILPSASTNGAAVAVGDHPLIRLSLPGWEPGTLATVLNKDLIPDYEAALVRAKKLIAEADATIVKSRATIELIKQSVQPILGNKTGEDGENLSIWTGGGNGRVWGDIRALGDRVDLNVRGLSKDVAIAILELIYKTEVQAAATNWHIDPPVGSDHSEPAKRR